MLEEIRFFFFLCFFVSLLLVVRLYVAVWNRLRPHDRLPII